MRTRQFEDEPKGPYGWIQWKGTSVCIDIHCTCGAHHHFDGDFMYYVKCDNCGQIYECDGHIRLHPIPADEFEAGKSEVCEPKLLDDLQDKELRGPKPPAVTS